MKEYSKFILSGFILCGVLFMSCGDDDPDMCDTSNITYSNSIASIFNASCATAGCHVDGNESRAFFSLEGYENASAAAGFGRIVGAISHEDGFSPMPRRAEMLDQCTIDKVASWIGAGAPE